MSQDTDPRRGGGLTADHPRWPPETSGSTSATGRRSSSPSSRSSSSSPCTSFSWKSSVDGIRRVVGDITGIRPLVDSWIMAGLLSVNAVTISLGVLGTMVSTSSTSDFPTSSWPRSAARAAVASYLISAWVIGFLFSLIALVAGELYIVRGEAPSQSNMLTVVGMIALAVVSSSSIMYLLASFLRSGSAFGTLSTLLGTLIGFITGVYVPGILPNAVSRGSRAGPLQPQRGNAAPGLLRSSACSCLQRSAAGSKAGIHENVRDQALLGAREISMTAISSVLSGSLSCSCVFRYEASRLQERLNTIERV